jgi:hypothetical protein
MRTFANGFDGGAVSVVDTTIWKGNLGVVPEALIYKP